jgi:Ser/Thr protein kinase RdoA (MazF antagonist)
VAIEGEDVLIPKPDKLRYAVAARTRPARIAEIEIGHVLRAYDLGELRGYRQPAAASGRSQNLILETSKGGKVLKKYKYSLSLEAIIYEHSLLRHLAVADFPAPRLAVNRNGETCTEFEGRFYAITDFVAGLKYTDFIISRRKRKRLIEKAAHTLARYHQLVDGFVPEGKKTDGFMPDGQKRWQECDWYLREFEKYRSLLRDREVDGTELERFFLHNIARFQQALLALDRRLGENSHVLPKLVIHGDYGPYNILFNGERLVAVLDFECAHLDWRAWEVVGDIQRFAGMKDGIDYDLARTFLSAYRSRGTLTADEIGLMPDIFRFSRLRGLIISLRDYFRLDAPARLHRARHKVWWVDWMEENGPRLIEALEA